MWNEKLDISRDFSWGFEQPRYMLSRGSFKNGVYVETDPTQPLMDAHYSDPRFNAAAGWPTLTIYGKKCKVKGATYHYSDRLMDADLDKTDRCREVARKAADEMHFSRRSVRYYEAFLTAYWGTPCHIHHVEAGVHQVNGDCVYLFGYTMERES